MKRKGIGIAIALLGSGCIVLSGLGEKEDIQGWEPLNLQVAQALGEEDTPSTLKLETQEVSSTSTSSKILNSSTLSNASELETNSDLANSSTSDNKAGTMATEQKVDQVKSSEQTTSENTSSDLSNTPKINVNTAGIKELMELPGIGEKKAQSILDYRNQHGPFRQISDLNDVKGIGTKMMEKISPLVEL